MGVKFLVVSFDEVYVLIESKVLLCLTFFSIFSKVEYTLLIFDIKYLNIRI